MRPFLKWAGNKYRLMSRIGAVLPEGRRLVEPFVGSGAVFLNTDYPEYRLADANPDLINVYRTLQREGQAFVDDCRQYFTPDYNAPDVYYALRDRFNASKDVKLRSVLFVYFNRHGYNGLCRYNSRGKFNVPFGRYTRPYFPQREMLEFHRKSSQAEFIHSPIRPTSLSPARPTSLRTARRSSAWTSSAASPARPSAYLPTAFPW
jgi:DNA adenine methylase